MAVNDTNGLTNTTVSGVRGPDGSAGWRNGVDGLEVDGDEEEEEEICVKNRRSRALTDDDWWCDVWEDIYLIEGKKFQSFSLISDVRVDVSSVIIWLK